MQAYAKLRIIFFIKDFGCIKFRNVAVNLFERHPCHGVVVAINLKLGLVFLLFYLLRALL